MAERRRLCFAVERHLAIGAALLALWVTGVPAAAQPVRPGTPVATFPDLSRALRACWQPPDDSAGSIITFRFGLDVAGQLKGKPLVTYSRLTGDGVAQRRFVAAALAALANCTPVPLDPGFAPIAASRVLTLTFSAPEARRQVPI
ncbi:hypothetical protein J5J86_20660 [Aquabacter sp. L1I39]|uniref:hypothetical protein n=1 Tax=Aquabacter sp. L1I39 TaxID=2820278 RepID=UPI001ADBB0DD|nr:hypothetical protein [Aquabacter sp. L1I39]QTL03139.1 hypothetical protein J5J86_20660 [Aquabacter sp. L1I39]